MLGIRSTNDATASLFSASSLSYAHTCLELFGTAPSLCCTEEAGVNYRAKQELKRWSARERRKKIGHLPRRQTHTRAQRDIRRCHLTHQLQLQQHTFVPQLEALQLICHSHDGSLISAPRESAPAKKLQLWLFTATWGDMLSPGPQSFDMPSFSFHGLLWI